MRWMCVLIVLVSGVARADDAEAERIRLARTAIEAKLKLGDALRAKGDLDAAIQAYREAVAIWDRFGKAPAAPERIVEEPIEAAAPARPVALHEVHVAIQRGIEWLAEHQDDDGRWDCDGFAKHDPQDDKTQGPGSRLYDVGVTSLAVLVLLRAGHTDKRQAFGAAAHRGLKWLMTKQDEAGCFGTRASQHFMYNATLATLAMSEGYRRTRDVAYKQAAQRGADFLARARNPYLAWRYEPRGGENDTSVTAWATAALRQARLAGLTADPDHLEGVRLWLDKMTDPEFGQVGYNIPGGSPARAQRLIDRFPPERSQAMTAAGIFLRIMVGEDPRKSVIVAKGAKLCQQVLPRWNEKDGSIDLYYWYYGTKAFFEIGGTQATTWNRALRAALVGAQNKKGAAAGSWDPAGAWGSDGGRVYATAISVLSLLESVRDPAERIAAVKK